MPWKKQTSKEELQGEKDGREKNSSDKDSGENKERKHFKVSTAVKKKKKKHKVSHFTEVNHFLSTASERKTGKPRAATQGATHHQFVSFEASRYKGLLSWRNRQRFGSGALRYAVCVRQIVEMKIISPANILEREVVATRRSYRFLSENKNKTEAFFLGWEIKRKVDISLEQMKRKTLCMVQSNNRKQRCDCLQKIMMVCNSWLRKIRYFSFSYKKESLHDCVSDERIFCRYVYK